MKFWSRERFVFLGLLVIGLLVVGYFGGELAGEVDSRTLLMGFAGGAMWVGMYAEKLLEEWRVHKWFGKELEER